MNPLNRKRLWLGVVFFTLYALTTARDVLPADSGEFQLAVAGWGVLHPPGYPLYTMLGALWVRLIPLGNVAFRLNLLSAVLASVTLILVTEAVRLWARHWGASRSAAWTGGLSAALLLGAAPTFWAQATTANIRMPTLLFIAWGFAALAHYSAQTEPASARTAADPALLSLALAVGLGVGHHPSLVFVALGWGVYLLLVEPALLRKPRCWWQAAAVAALAWLVPQLYIPIRGGMQNVPLAGEGLNTWQGFWFHVLARGFAGDMFAFATARDLALRLPLLNSLFGLQFPRWTLLGIGLAWFWLLRRRWRLAMGLLVSWLAHTFVTITYRAPQTVEYLMPAYVPMAVVFGLGTAEVWRRASARPRVAVRLVVTLLPLALLARIPLHLGDFMTLALDTSVRERVAPLLQQADTDALILADWRWATPLWVLQYSEGLGRDAEVAYVYPVEGKDYEQVWRERVEAAGDRALYTTHAYDWPEWARAPVGGGYRLFRRPLTALPTELGYTPIEADLGPVRLLGYRLRGEARPGRPLEVQLAWQAIGPQAPAPSLTVRLFDGNDQFLGNADRFLGSDAAPGEVRFTEITLALPLSCIAEAALRVGVYTVEDNGFNHLGEAPLTQLRTTCETPRWPTAHVHPGVLGNRGPFLRGVDYDVGEAAITAYLHLCGPGAPLLVRGEREVSVDELGIAQCRTVSVPVQVDEHRRPTLTFTRPDGTAVRLMAFPLPRPAPTERYVPFGDALVLVGAETAQRGGRFVVDLHWRSARPLIEDYAVSLRILEEDGRLLGVHDTQPGLGALPTLKWVVRGVRILDPHAFAPPEGEPTKATVVVYERFRGTPLPVGTGLAGSFPLH
ncbi:MAG: protein O-mannosyl-transferase family [Anaerolineae bacterium]